MNSVLGTIQLGMWELGALRPGSATATCLGAAKPSSITITKGGVQSQFSAVLGTIQLGYFELGAVPQLNFKAGQHTAYGAADPLRISVPSPPVAVCSGLAYPQRVSTPNKGPLVAFGRGDPARAVSYTFYYPTMTCEGLGDPTRDTNPIVAVAAVGIAYPIRKASPIIGQSVSCVTGSLLDITGELTNGSW
jgi:hypothetical protein